MSFEGPHSPVEKRVPLEAIQEERHVYHTIQDHGGPCRDSCDLLKDSTSQGVARTGQRRNEHAGGGILRS